MRPRPRPRQTYIPVTESSAQSAVESARQIEKVCSPLLPISCERCRRFSVVAFFNHVGVRVGVRACVRESMRACTISGLGCSALAGIGISDMPCPTNALQQGNQYKHATASRCTKQTSTGNTDLGFLRAGQSSMLPLHVRRHDLLAHKMSIHERMVLGWAVAFPQNQKRLVV